MHSIGNGHGPEGDLDIARAQLCHAREFDAERSLGQVSDPLRHEITGRLNSNGLAGLWAAMMLPKIGTVRGASQ